MTALPFGDFRLTVMLRLFEFSIVKYRLSAPFTSCNWPRVMSPRPGISTLITSAPIHASSWVAVGPAWTWPKSRMRTPSSALLIAYLT